MTTEWAIEHKDEILAAARLRQDVTSSSAIGATGGGDLITRFAQALNTRLAAVRERRPPPPDPAADPRRHLHRASTRR